MVCPFFITILTALSFSERSQRAVASLSMTLGGKGQNQVVIAVYGRFPIRRNH